MKPFNQFKSPAKQKLYETFCKESDKRWPIESKEYYVETTYGSTFVRESGSGAPLILLPGLQVGSISYASMIEELSKEFQVFAIDIVGDFGKSYVTNPIKSEEDYILWQSELYSKLNLPEKFNILGTSLGAWLGSLYAVENPEKVSGLILISPAGVVENMNRSTMITGMLSNILPFARKLIFRKTFETIRNSPNGSKILDSEIYGPMAIIKKTFKPYLPLVPKQLPVEKMVKMNKTLYIVGEKETLHDAHRGKTFFDAHVTEGKSIIIPNVGHDFIMMNSSFIVEKVIYFLKK